MPDSDFHAFLAERLPLAPVGFVPEIRLHGAVPTSGLTRLAERDPRFTAPYWAHQWGGGLALARYVLDQVEEVRGRRVLDLGTGSGLVAIAAAKAGARHVEAADIDPRAIAAAGANAQANGVTLALACADLLDGGAPEAEVVLVGDLFYDATLAARVLAFVDRCAAAGARVLVGDPWRAPLPRHRLAPLAEYRLREGSGPLRAAAVFALRPPTR